MTQFFVLFLGGLLVIGAIAIGAIIYFMKRFQAQVETVECAPLRAIHDLQPGLQKANGSSVALEKTLVSPLTQTECVFYHFKVEELQVGRQDDTSRRRRPNSPMTSTWVAVVNDRQAVPCALQDDSGTATVDLLGAEMVLTTGKPKESNFLQSCPPELQETLKRRYDFSTKGLLLSKSLRFTEMLIRPGDKLLVVGDVEVKEGESPRFVKRGHSFIVSDKDEAGVLGEYRRKILGCKIGMGIVAAVMLVFAIGPIYLMLTGPGPKPAAKQDIAKKKLGR